jgi:hypothetical protein
VIIQPVVESIVLYGFNEYKASDGEKGWKCGEWVQTHILPHLLNPTKTTKYT